MRKARIKATRQQMIDMGIDGVIVNGEVIKDGMILDIKELQINFEGKPAFQFVGTYNDLIDHTWYISADLFEFI